jgi:hypothetical protein
MYTMQIITELYCKLPNFALVNRANLGLNNKTTLIYHINLNRPNAYTLQG